VKKFLLATFFCLSCSAAWACPSPLTGKDAAGTTQNFGVTLDGSANCYGNVALVDGSNAANKATVTAANALKVDGSAVTQPVSGTVTSNQGGAPWSVSQSGNWTARVVGNAGGVFDFAGQNATQPANSVLIGGEFNTTPTTITSGNASPLQLDASGNLLVNIKANSFGTLTVSGTVTANQGTSPWVDNITQFGGTNISTGTGASGAGIPRVTVANDSNILATQSGVWTTRVVGNAGGIFDAAGQNAASPANEILTACQFNTAPTTVTSGNVTPVQCNNAGALNVAIVSGGGSGGTASSFGAAFPATGTAVGVKNGINMVNLAADGSSNLLVNCAVGCGASGFADLGAFTLGVSNVNVMAGIYETSPAPVAPGQGAAAMITGNRALFTNLRDSSGQELGANLPGQINAPLRTSQAQTLPGIPAFPPSASQIWDGQHYLSLVPPNSVATQVQTAIVVRNPDAGNIADPTYGGSGNATENSVLKGLYAAVTSSIPAGSNTIGAVTQAAGPWTVNCVSGCTGGGGGGTTELVNSAGQQLGAVLPGLNNIPLSTNQAITLPSPAPFPPIARMLWDGQHYVSVTPPNVAAIAAQTGLVVSISPNSTATISGTVTANAGSGTFTVGGTVTANQGTSPWVENVSQFGGSAVVTGTGASGAGIPRVTVSNDSNVLATQNGTWTVQQGTPPWSVVGNVASGTSDSGNPVKTGGVFNTTQPTVTTGQRVDSQSTARGALIVATGVDAFTVAGSGTFTVSGTVTANQGTSPWVDNISQFGGVNISTGTGASGTGIPRVTVSNDSNVLATQSGTWTVQPGNTANTTPWLTSISQGGNTAAVNASSQLSVNCANCSGSGVSQQDATGFTFATTNMVPIGGVYSAAPSQLTSGQAGVALLTQGRILMVDERDASGQEKGSKLQSTYSPPVQVNIASTVQNNTLLKPQDPYGQSRVASMITDGTDYVSLTTPGKPAKPLDTAIVVTPSPIPTLQCPFIAAVSQTASTTTVTGQAGKFLHICSYKLIASAAMNVGLVEGTGTTCATGITALDGSTAGSIPLAANGGFQTGQGAGQVVIPMQKNGDNLCVLSGTGTVAGYINYGIFN
jgi:hypothetical protein